MIAHIDVVEVAPRDGLQNEAVDVSAADKVALVLRAADLGARRIEAVSFVNPRAVPRMADAEAVMAVLRSGPRDLRREGVRLAGLALNRRGFARAVAAGVDEINAVVVATETFNRRNQGGAIADTLAELVAGAALAREARIPVTVTIAAAFGCPFEGEVACARVVELARAAWALGAAEIALADTIGVADPLAVESRIAAVRAALPDAPLRLHLHDTRNTGLANAYAGLRAGVRALDASIGGIGGCPFAPAATGNIATEDLAYMLGRMGVGTGLDLPRLIAAALWLEGVLGRSVPGLLSRAGVFPPAGDDAQATDG